MKGAGQYSGVAYRVALSAGLIGTLASACQTPQTPTDTIMLSWSDNDRSIVVGVGDQVEVALRVVGPYYYGSPSVSSSSVHLVRQWDELPAQPTPGGPKTQRYLLEAVAAGRADITILRELPGADASVFRISVEVD